MKKSIIFEYLYFFYKYILKYFNNLFLIIKELNIIIYLLYNK